MSSAYKFTECDLEIAILDHLENNLGYTYSSADSFHRTEKDALLKDDFYTYLRKRYPNVTLTDSEMASIIAKLEYIPSFPLYTGSRDTFWLINEGFDFLREDKSGKSIHIDYIDFENIDNNVFRIVNQYKFKPHDQRRIPDILIFINGIPIAIFELKSVSDERVTVHDAWEQITIRYTRDIPELLKYCFLSVISDGANSKLGTIFSSYEFYYGWNKANDEEKVSKGVASLITLLDGAFAKNRIIQILRDFIFFSDPDSKDTMIVCRYPQFFAANKMLENIKQHLKPAGDGKGGIYFGATGCGKTYTMLFLSRMLMQRDQSTFNNPTIIIITDREDLDDQTSKKFVSAKRFLGEKNVKSIETREILGDELRNRPSGGVYVTTIQKFCETTGLLSDRANIICISDEAHRTQTGIGAKTRQTENGVEIRYGFAKYLRDSFPNATYCGFTGTPIDESIAVFGGVVDKYTMKESSDDGITVGLAYEPRLARVAVNEEELRKIEKYYEKCAEDWASEDAIEKSKSDNSKLAVILGNQERLEKLAADIVTHYETLCAQKPKIVQKAMVVSSTRMNAYRLMNEILKIRPEWAEKKKSEDASILSKAELDELVALPKINLVATQGDNDSKELFEACGNQSHRKMLDVQFKNDNSNFRIAVVVDMWITGFDVPSLAVMYIDKPLQKHTLIQTISRVNRVFEGKDQGLIVDYIGFRKDMLLALKQYGDPDDTDGGREDTVQDISKTLIIYRALLSLLKDLFSGFDYSLFFNGSPMQRLNTLNETAEFVQQKDERLQKFMLETKKLKAAFSICFPSGELTDEESLLSQFYLAIRSLIYKQTKPDAPDAEIMNEVVEKLVQDAMDCSGIENILGPNKRIQLFDDEFKKELDAISLPISKFNVLQKILKQTIADYRKTNIAKAADFEERLKKVVDKYNDRDNTIFVSNVVEDFVNDLSDKLYDILSDIEKDKEEFKRLGISYDTKVYYDILVKVRNEHEFEFNDEKCLALAGKIKDSIDEFTGYIDCFSKSDTRNKVIAKLITLLYESGYPPEWSKEAYIQILEQAERFDSIE